MRLEIIYFQECLIETRQAQDTDQSRTEPIPSFGTPTGAQGDNIDDI